MSLEHVLEYAHTHAHARQRPPRERHTRARPYAPFFSLRLRGEAGLQTTRAPQSGNYCLLEMHASLYIQLTKVEQNRYKRAHCFVFCKTGAVKGRNSGAQVAVAVQRGARRHRRSRAAQAWQLHRTLGRETSGGIGFEVRKAAGRVAEADSWVTAALRRATGAAVGGYRDFGAAAMPKRAT